MKSKKIIALLVTGVMLFPTVAFAQNATHQSANVKNHIIEQVNENLDNASEKASKVLTAAAPIEKGEGKLNNQEKKDQIATFKTAIKDKHSNMKDIFAEIKTAREDIKVQKEQLRNLLKDIKSGKSKLADSDLKEISALAEDLKADSSKVKATAGLQKDTENLQEEVNKNDFNNAIASLDKVIAKLNARLAALEELKTHLNSLIVKIHNSESAVTGTTT